MSCDATHDSFKTVKHFMNFKMCFHRGPGDDGVPANPANAKRRMTVNQVSFWTRIWSMFGSLTLLR
jgi:hypothetical protein